MQTCPSWFATLSTACAHHTHCTQDIAASTSTWCEENGSCGLNPLWMCSKEQTPDHILPTCPQLEAIRQQFWPQDTHLHTKLWGPVDDLHTKIWRPVWPTHQALGTCRWPTHQALGTCLTYTPSFGDLSMTLIPSSRDLPTTSGRRPTLRLHTSDVYSTA